MLHPVVTEKSLAQSISEGANLFLSHGNQTATEGYAFDEDGNVLSYRGQEYRRSLTGGDDVSHYRSKSGSTALYDPATGFLAVSGVDSSAARPLLTVAEVEVAIKAGVILAGRELGSLTQAEMRFITAEATRIVASGMPVPVPASAVQGVVGQMIKAVDEKKVDTTAIEREIEKEKSEREKEQERERQRLESLAAYANSPMVQNAIEAHAAGALTRVAVAIELLARGVEKIYEEYAIRRAERQKALTTEVTHLAKSISLQEQARELVNDKQSPIHNIAKSRGINLEGKKQEITVFEHKGQQMVRFAPGVEVAATVIQTTYVSQIMSYGGMSYGIVSEQTIRINVLEYTDARETSARLAKGIEELISKEVELERRIINDIRSKGITGNNVLEMLQSVNQISTQLRMLQECRERRESLEQKYQEAQNHGQQAEKGRVSLFEELIATTAHKQEQLAARAKVKEGRTAMHEELMEKAQARAARLAGKDSDYFQKLVTSQSGDKGNGLGQS
ncbi:MAG: hypothetical protein JSS50_04580 [Proteobacteria bacterium]|nr:hypothetical protein [Pseudomonadota bacterium]